MPIIGIENRATWATISRSSDVSPELEIRITRSSGVIMPRSPWLASAGCTKADGVPVEASVELILRAIWPDLPIPPRMTRPCVERIASTAASKSSGGASAVRSTASPSIRSTRRAVALAGSVSASVPTICSRSIRGRPIADGFRLGERSHGWHNGRGRYRTEHEPSIWTPTRDRAALHAAPRGLCDHRRGRWHSRHLSGGPAPELPLPGGGIDPGESPLHALAREVMEETGYAIHGLRRLGMFHRFTYMPEYDLHAQKQCHIYAARLGPRRSEPTEEGHSAVFLPWAEACDLLAVSGDRHFVSLWLKHRR